MRTSNVYETVEIFPTVCPHFLFGNFHLDTLNQRIIHGINYKLYIVL